MAAKHAIKSARGQTADVTELWARIREGAPSGYYCVALLGLRNYEPLRIAATVERGLAYSTLLRLERNSTLPAATIAESAQISPRTLARRKKSGKLEPDESDRLVRVSRIIARAMELFEGDTAATRVWLSSSQAALGGAVPLEFAKTDVGAREVDNLIGRLEHGIPT